MRPATLSPPSPTSASAAEKPPKSDWKTLGKLLPGMPMTYDQWLLLQTDNVATLPGLEAFGIEPTPMEAIAPGYLERFRTAGRFHRARAARFSLVFEG